MPASRFSGACQEPDMTMLPSPSAGSDGEDSIVPRQQAAAAAVRIAPIRRVVP